jgi:hypothetical protein
MPNSTLELMRTESRRLACRLACRLTRPLAILLSIAALGVPAKAAEKDDRLLVVAKLRQVVWDIAALPDEKQHQFAKDSEVWFEEIGPAQLAAGDLEGALETIRTLDHDGLVQPWNMRFLRDLAAALTRSGKGIEPAYEVITLRGERQPGRYAVEERLAIALGQADAKDAEGALRTCREATGPRMDNSDIARVQICLGDGEGARKSLKLIEAEAQRLPLAGEGRALLNANMALAYWQLGDKPKADRILADAIRALDNGRLGTGYALRHLSVVSAKLGNASDAMRIAGQIPEKTDDRTLAWTQIVVALWARGDLAEAQKTVLLPEFSGYGFNDMLLEIATAYARKKEFKQSYATAGLVKDDLPRAQAILEVAAIQARAGSVPEALAAVTALDYPISTRTLEDKRDPRPFKFNDPQTWGLPFLSNSQFYISSWHWHSKRMEGEFVAATVRCCVAIKGPGSIHYMQEMKDWDVRRAAEAQASVDDAVGALAWSDKLPQSRQLDALVGIAEGIGERRRAQGNQPQKPRLHSRHILREQFDDLYFDE